MCRTTTNGQTTNTTYLFWAVVICCRSLSPSSVALCRPSNGAAGSSARTGRSWKLQPTAIETKSSLLFVLMSPGVCVVCRIYAWQGFFSLELTTAINPCEAITSFTLALSKIVAELYWSRCGLKARHSDGDFCRS